MTFVLDQDLVAGLAEGWQSALAPPAVILDRATALTILNAMAHDAEYPARGAAIAALGTIVTAPTSTLSAPAQQAVAIDKFAALTALASVDFDGAVAAFKALESAEQQAALRGALTKGLEVAGLTRDEAQSRLSKVAL